jgi:MFS family permease
VRRLRPHTIPLQEHERWQRALVRDAGWASLTGSLYSGVILVGLALALGAPPIIIGVLAAVPFIAQAAQLPAIALVERLRQRKRIALGALTVARALILGLAIIPLVPPGAAQIALLLGAQLGVAVLNSISGCAVNSWLHQLVPPERLGAFFSRKLFWATTMACAGTFVAGMIVDHWTFGSRLWAYSTSFAGAAVAGFVSTWYLHKVPEPPMTHAGPAVSVVAKILSPFRDPRFRRVLIYLAAWNAACNVAAPFITVYLMRQLGLTLGAVTTLWVASQIANALTLYAWGRLSDRLTNKAILAVALPAYFASLVALVYVTAPATDDGVPMVALYMIHVLMGCASAGIGLATGNMSLKLAPAGQGTAYLGATSLVGSVMGGLAPIVGGALAQSFQASTLSIVVRWLSPSHTSELALIDLTRWEFLFVISALLGLYVMHAASRIEEDGKISERRVIQEFGLEALRTLNQLSSVAGLLGNFFNFGRPSERRLRGRRAERAQG